MRIGTIFINTLSTFGSGLILGVVRNVHEL